MDVLEICMLFLEVVYDQLDHEAVVVEQLLLPVAEQQVHPRY